MQKQHLCPDGSAKGNAVTERAVRPALTLEARTTIATTLEAVVVMRSSAGSVDTSGSATEFFNEMHAAILSYFDLHVSCVVTAIDRLESSSDECL